MKRFLEPREFISAEISFAEPFDVRKNEEIERKNSGLLPCEKKETITTRKELLSYLPGTNIKQGPFSRNTTIETISKEKWKCGTELIEITGYYFQGKLHGKRYDKLSRKKREFFWLRTITDIYKRGTICGRVTITDGKGTKPYYY